MERLSQDCGDVIEVDFESVPIDVTVEKYIFVRNNSNNNLTYRVSNVYILDTIDCVFKVYITSTPVKPGDGARVKVIFKPNVVGTCFTEYYVIHDNEGNSYRLTATGKCFGPLVHLDKKKIVFEICRNFAESRNEVIHIVNKSAVDTTFQWYMPNYGQGHFQITGICGLIRAHETITTSVVFTGSALGVYTAELVCLILNQEPLYLNIYARVFLQGAPSYDFKEHTFEKYWRKISPQTHLMENSLNRLMYKPSASVFERYLDFSTGSVRDVTKNISQTICVTNHEQKEGYIQWMPDPDNVFMIEPISSKLSPNSSRLFTVRFRPKIDNEIYGYLMCGDYQHVYKDSDSETVKTKHTWFRIPCTGNTWLPCTEWITEWDCPIEVVLPPTVPTRTTFTNFMLSNKFEIPMHFKFEAPYGTNFVVMPICGIVEGRGWQIISVALEPKCFGDYCETWDLIINKVQSASRLLGNQKMDSPNKTNKVRICFVGNAEMSQIEVTSHGYHPSTHALLEFPPTIAGCTNYCTTYLHNLTRMEIHIRVLNNVPWLGADKSGTIVIPPKEIVHFRWWFFPRIPDKVYETTITFSCVCLIKGRPVGEPTEVFIHISGFSELPDLKVLPKTMNLHDITVGDSSTISITLYNFGSCYFTSRLYYLIDGMGDDFSGDRFEIDSPVNSLKPSNHCDIKLTVTPDGAGPRRISIKYTVLFRTEHDEVEEIQPIIKNICVIWYDGIFPTIKVLRTICVQSPIIFSNHCVWNNTNVDELNKAFADCRPNKPLDVNLYAPDLCIRSRKVEFIFVIGCVYAVPVPWDLRREKICYCEMVEEKVGTSLYEMRHNCIHRPLVELHPLSGVALEATPSLLHLKFKYYEEGFNTLCYVMTMPNQRSINIYINIFANINTKGILTPLRRAVYQEQYLAVLDCGRVPINNLDPVIRLVWLYNPTDVFATWRLIRGTSSNNKNKEPVIQCLLYFAEVPAFGRLAIPFAFLPSEMIDYEMVFSSSFGYDTVKILVKGQGGLPNCHETRLDMPDYVKFIAREVYRNEVVYLSKEHLTLPIMPTHSLWRELISICNDTDHVIRFIWLPEKIANILTIVMTPCWGMIQPKSAEWITMTIYSLKEPATFTTIVACELMDLTERKRFRHNEVLRRTKIEKCFQEFTITEKGTFYPDINDSPPYVENLSRPEPSYLALSVSVSTKGQRDGYCRMLMRQMWEQVPPYDLISLARGNSSDRHSSGNHITWQDITRIIDGILWDALHSKMCKNQIQFYSEQDVPTYMQIMKRLTEEQKPLLSRRVSSGVCDAIVNKAIFHVYDLRFRHELSLLEA